MYKNFYKLLFFILILTGGSVATFAQKDPPPKPKPPVIKPKPKPKPKPTPSPDNSPSYIDASIAFTFFKEN
ncbi:MAG: hypothetical protein ACK5NT_02380 [Pyrinomonadaceae bacterium]